MTTALKPVRRSRPAMPNYGITPKAEGLLDWEWVQQRLVAAHNYWICTTRPDGRPHAAPVWGGVVDGEVYFGTDKQSVKARNLTANPAVVVHLESGDEAVIIEGRAEPATDQTKLARLAEQYAPKYDWRLEPDSETGRYEGFWVVRMERVFAWLEKDFPNTATRWEFE